MSIKISGFSSTGGGGGGGISLPAFYATGVGAANGGGNTNGYAQVNFNVNAFNITPLFFVASDKSGGTTDGYGNGADANVAVVENNGATNWEYVWLSYSQFALPAAGGFTSNASLSGNWIGIIEVLLGDGVTPALSSSFTGDNAASNTMSVYNVTVNANEFAVLTAGVEYNGGNIVSVSQSGLTWTRKSAVTYDGSPDNSIHNNQTAEVWYAKNNTGNTVNGPVTITYQSQFDDASAIISTWTGVNFTNPWA